MTPGKFIISASPITRRRRSRASRSPAVSSRRGDSNLEAGTHEEAMNQTSSGIRPQTSSSQCTPSVPSTFAISCGSATTAVVPNGSTSRANSSTRSFDDSRCMWASTNPGTTKRPDGVERLAAVVGAEPGDRSVDDGDVDVEPLAREDGEHTAAAHDEVGGLVAARDREPARERCSHSGGNRTVPPMDVLTPRSLAEALELKAEHPDALPIQGGTDVMVALNFDRARPGVVLQPERGRRAARLVARGRVAAARRRA